MPKTSYNHIAGQSIERLAALSDGIFAVAMTLLVLDLHTPASQTIHSEAELWHVLGAIVPQLVMFGMSFLTLGIFWTGQQTQLNHFAHSDRHLTWIHIAFLFAVSMIPFATHLLADFMEYRTALIIYWLNILILGLLLYISWVYASRTKLVKPDRYHAVNRIIRRRIVNAQVFYAFGGFLCFYSTYWSIGCIVLLQLNYAIAPTFFFNKGADVDTNGN